jgi:hypothetical protein
VEPEETELEPDDKLEELEVEPDDKPEALELELDEELEDSEPVSCPIPTTVESSLLDESFIGWLV